MIVPVPAGLGEVRSGWIGRTAPIDHRYLIEATHAKRFTFSTIGQLVAIGRRTGVANILGLKFSGFFAWWLWRTIYLIKLPRFEKKLRVALDWTLDLLFSKDFVQFVTFRAPTISRAKEERSPRKLRAATVPAVLSPAGATSDFRNSGRFLGAAQKQNSTP